MEKDQILFTSGDTQKLKIGPYRFKDARLVLPDPTITAVPVDEQIEDFRKRLASVDAMTRGIVRELSVEAAEKVIANLRQAAPSAHRGVMGSSIGPKAEVPSAFTAPVPEPIPEPEPQPEPESKPPANPFSK